MERMDHFTVPFFPFSSLVFNLPNYARFQREISDGGGAHFPTSHTTDRFWSRSNLHSFSSFLPPFQLKHIALSRHITTNRGDIQYVGPLAPFFPNFRLSIVKADRVQNNQFQAALTILGTAPRWTQHEENILNGKSSFTTFQCVGKR